MGAGVVPRNYRERQRAVQKLHGTILDEQGYVEHDPGQCRVLAGCRHGSCLSRLSEVESRG
jgi:hypothetical protein